MTASEYIYSKENLLVKPQKYKFTKFEGIEFLYAYIESRKKQILRLNIKIPDQNEIENILHNENKRKISNTEKKLTNICLELINEKAILELDRSINFYLKKFEVTKKIFSNYDTKKEFQEYDLFGFGMDAEDVGGSIFPTLQFVSEVGIGTIGLIGGGITGGIPGAIAGGATGTAGNIIFATGTVDKKIRAFNANNGQEVWSYELPFAGSGPPSVYSVNGEQYVVVAATGSMSLKSGYPDLIEFGNWLYCFKLKLK